MLGAKRLYIYQRISVLKAVYGTLGICCYVYLAVTLGDVLHTALLGAALAVTLVAIAYAYPTLTLVCWAGLTLYAELLLPFVAVYIGGGVDLYLSDPVLFAMMGALGVRLALSDQRLKNALFKHILFWTLFVGWLGFQVVRSVGLFGIVSPLGEFRTYFQEILVVPYIIVSFRDRDQQWQCFRALLVLSLFGLLAVAVYQALALNVLTFGLRAAGNLALVYGACALFLMYRYGRWKYGHTAYLVLLSMVILATVLASHRSVWLAAATILVVLILLGYLPLSHFLGFAALLILGVLVADSLYSGTNVIAHLEKRLLAFTSYQDDPTAKWRYHVWQDALQQVRQQPLTGKGLGNYFRTVDHRGLVVTVSLHNQYVQLVYQVGLIGLLLYLAFVTQCLRHFWRTYTGAIDRDARLMVLVALAVLVAGSAYFVPYTYDTFTWLFVGLGLAVSQNCLEQEERVTMRGRYADEV